VLHLNLGLDALVCECLLCGSELHEISCPSGDILLLMFLLLLLYMLLML
jgi:hypothetical protein